jgi:hypothetical protein
MGRDLTAVGSVTYNGFTFPAPLTAKVTANAIYDEADRTIIQIDYTLVIEAAIFPDDAPQSTAGAEIGENLDDIRSRLQKSGQGLTFTSQGFGSFAINGSSTVKDINFGPKPRVLVWEPIGTNRAVRIVWTCETSIPECTDSVPKYANTLSSFTYDARWSITESGLTRRSITGTLTIPAQLSGADGISDTADKYRYKLRAFKPPLGFHREQDYSLSRDKRTLEFVLVDTEIPSDNPFFPGTIKADINHEINSSLSDGGFRIWNCTISGSVEVKPTARKSLAWQAFLHVVKDRMERATRARHGTDTPLETGKTLVTYISLADQVYGRTLSFTVRYWLYSNPNTLAMGSGIFSPVHGTSWSTWRGSISEVVDIRGNAKMNHLAHNDVIINLCTGDPISASTEQGVVRAAPTQAEEILSAVCPSPSESWLKFKNDFLIVENTEVIQHKKLGQSKSRNEVRDPPSASSSSDASPQLPFSQSRDTSSDYAYQLRGPGTYTLRMFGYAYRLGYPIGVPIITRIGNKVPLIKDKQFKTKKLVHTSNCTLYFASWVIDYYLDGPPTGTVDNMDINVFGIPREHQ